MLFSLVSTSLPQSHLTTLILWTVFAPRWSSYLNKQDFLQVELIFHYITVLINCKPFVNLGRSFVYLTAGSEISYVFEHFDRILSRLSSPIIMGFTGALVSPLNSALLSWVTSLWMLSLTREVETEVITLPLTKTDTSQRWNSPARAQRLHVQRKMCTEWNIWRPGTVAAILLPFWWFVGTKWAWGFIHKFFSM